MPKDPPAPKLSKSMNEVMNSFKVHYPDLIQTTNAGILPTELAKLDAARQVIPGQTQLISDANRQMILDDTNTLRTASPAFIDAIRRSEEQLNPGSTELRSDVIGGYQAGIDSLNPNNIFPEAERLVNLENIRSGNMGNSPNATNTTANAMRFGEYKTNRINQLNNLLNGATGFLNAGTLKADYLGRPLAQQTSATQFANVGNTALDVSDQMFGTVSGMKQQQNQINADRRSGFEVVMGSMPSYS